MILNTTRSLPKHIAIIMDGNGRWAESQEKQRSEGHLQGAENLRNVLEYCSEYNIDYLTVYAFSTENWNRPEAEVEALMSLLIEFLKAETEKLYNNGIQLRVIGDTSLMPETVQKEIKNALIRLTIPEHKRVLTLALSYGGRNEIVRATKAISRDITEGKITLDEINEDLFSSYLDTAGIPDPDLLIRTAGELRLSNFMLWQLSYAELYSTNKYWPDFTKDEFIKALDNFNSRTRKFGEIK